MRLTLVIIKLALLCVLINIAGRFLWPFTTYTTGYDIGILCYFVSGTVALCGIITLIVSFIKKRNKSTALWIIATAGSLYSCCFISIYERFGENGNYVNDFIMFSEYKEDLWPNTHGLADKFGCEFIAPHYHWVVKAFDKKDSEVIYIGIKSKEAHVEKNDSVDSIGSNPDYYTFKLHLHNEEGKLKKTIDVTESDCDFIDEHIEKHIGEILETYIYRGYVAKSDMRILKSKQANNKTGNEIASHSEEEYTDEEYETDNSDDEEEETPEIIVKHVKEPQQVWKQRWKPCISCDRGKCGQCHGQGGYYIGDYYNTCTSCYGTGACIWCEGRGEIMETYSVWE